MSSTVIKTKIFSIILYSLAFLQSYAVIASEPSLRFERLSIEEGLPQTTVNTVLVDEKGFLWVGTNDGLARYDTPSPIELHIDTNQLTYHVRPGSYMLAAVFYLWLNKFLFM